MNTQLEELVHPITERAGALTINDSDSMAEAVSLLSLLNKTNDRIVSEKEKVTKPLNEALKAERGRWKPFEDVLAGAIATVRSRMGAYQLEQTKIAKAKEEALASRVAPGRGNLTLSTAAKKMADIEKPEHLVTTEEGAVRFRTDKVLVITDANLIPKEYLIPDEKAILAALKAGKSIAGTAIEERMVPVNYR